MFNAYFLIATKTKVKRVVNLDEWGNTWINEIDVSNWYSIFNVDAKIFI